MPTVILSLLWAGRGLDVNEIGSIFSCSFSNPLLLRSLGLSFIFKEEFIFMLVLKQVYLNMTTDLDEEVFSLPEQCINVRFYFVY